MLIVLYRLLISASRWKTLKEKTDIASLCHIRSLPLGHMKTHSTAPIEAHRSFCLFQCWLTADWRVMPWLDNCVDFQFHCTHTHTNTHKPTHTHRVQLSALFIYNYGKCLTTFTSSACAPLLRTVPRINSPELQVQPVVVVVVVQCV